MEVSASVGKERYAYLQLVQSFHRRHKTDSSAWHRKGARVGVADTNEIRLRTTLKLWT